MPEIIVVDDVNKDDISRKVGYYLYSETQVWFEDNLVHRTDGPAVVYPDGVRRWYINGKEITLAVNKFFTAHNWKQSDGLDTPEKVAQFKSEFAS